MTSYDSTKVAIVQHAVFCPPLPPTIQTIDLAVLQQYAATVTVLELGPMSYQTFLAADVPLLLVRAMPQLTDFKLVLIPPNTLSIPTDFELVLKPPNTASSTVLPQVRLRLERIPALQSLHIQGASLVCDSFTRLKRLELHNTTQAPLGHTCAEFLAMLSTGKALEHLVLENYMGIMDAEDPTGFHFPLMCKTALVKDSARNLFRLLAHLSEVPDDMRMVVIRSTIRVPEDLDPLPLKGLYPPMQKSVHCATFKSLVRDDGIELVCAGSKHIISIEDSTTPPMPLLDPARTTVHNAALNVLSHFLVFMPVSTLEISDPMDITENKTWFKLLERAPNVSELIVTKRGPSKAVCKIFTALASFSSQAVETAVRCPHLKDVKVRGTVYSRALVDTIGQTAKWRAEHGGPFRSLELLLAPRVPSGPRPCEFASIVARRWAKKLTGNGYVDRVRITDDVEESRE
ncbi:hypothetical protein OH76DRAFT_1406463 [Lentinus brumalis]|uniref:Uncharacterized protein n=1 Tax=Lentinus brumalis TaxID=2498619 RepID=A0A371D2W4_9APHY|nr:hypothetical protein OH76DRAFT_1406463 [Polyporus brumalis]